MAWVEKDHNDHRVSTPPAMCRVDNHQTRLPRATSSLALNASRDGTSTTSLGNLFQCVTTLWVIICWHHSSHLKLSQIPADIVTVLLPTSTLLKQWGTEAFLQSQSHGHLLLLCISTECLKSRNHTWSSLKSLQNVWVYLCYKFSVPIRFSEFAQTRSGLLALPIFHGVLKKHECWCFL